MALPGVNNVIIDRSNHRDHITYLDDGKDKIVTCECGEWKIEVLYVQCDSCGHIDRKCRTIN